MTGDAAGRDPAEGDRGMGDPAAGDPATSDPATSDPAVGDPAAGDPAVGDPATREPATRSQAARGLAAAVAAAAVGAGLSLLAARGQWEHDAALLRPAARTGGDLFPWLGPVGWVALAGAGALVAVRGVPRQIVGGLLCLAGAAFVSVAALGVVEGARLLWPAAGAVGGLLVVGAGAAATARGASWPTLGARYARGPGERPQAEPGGSPGPGRQGAALEEPGREPDNRDSWRALDRGEDPTVDRP